MKSRFESFWMFGLPTIPNIFSVNSRCYQGQIRYIITYYLCKILAYPFNTWMMMEATDDTNLCLVDMFIYEFINIRQDRLSPSFMFRTMYRNQIVSSCFVIINLETCLTTRFHSELRK